MLPSSLNSIRRFLEESNLSGDVLAELDDVAEWLENTDYPRGEVITRITEPAPDVCPVCKKPL